MSPGHTWIALFAVAGAGCSLVTGVDDADRPVQTAESAVVLASDAAGVRGLIPFTFVNRLPHPVFIVNCRGSYGLGLERETDSGWTGAWSPALPACLSPPIVVGPGERLVDTVHVFGGHHDTNNYPRFDQPDPTGTYRLVLYDVLSSYDDGDYPFGHRIAERHRISNRFTISVATTP